MTPSSCSICLFALSHDFGCARYRRGARWATISRSQLISSKPSGTSQCGRFGASASQVKAHARASSTVKAISSARSGISIRSEEHTSELQSRGHLVCRLLLEKKKKIKNHIHIQHNQHMQ